MQDEAFDDAGLASRVRAAREWLGFTQKELATRLRVSVATVQNWERGTYVPSMAILVQLSKSGVSPAFLLLGQGTVGTPKGTVSVPRIAVEASAGDGSMIDSEAIMDFQPFKAEDIRRLSTDPSNLVVIRVRGDSMLPTLADGDQLLVDLSAGQAISDGIYALGVDDVLQVKRLVHRPGFQVRVVSDNVAYPSYDIDPATEGIRIVGRVLWAGHFF